MAIDKPVSVQILRGSLSNACDRALLRLLKVVICLSIGGFGRNRKLVWNKYKTARRMAHVCLASKTDLTFPDAEPPASAGLINGKNPPK